MVTRKASPSLQHVLLTGGAGFIGSHLVNILLAAKHNVCVVDNLSYGKRRFLPEDGLNFRFVHGDILDFDMLFKLFGDFRPSLVYHLAAISHIPTCESHPLHALRVNVEGTQSTLKATSMTTSVQRLVFASSGAVYDFLDEPLAEDSPVVPHDVYGASKVAGEQLVRITVEKTGLQSIVARIFNTVGPRETNAHLVRDILAQVIRGERCIRLGNLKPRRSFIHVKDVAEALFALGKASPVSAYEVLNVGIEQDYSVEEVVALLSELLGYQLQAVREEERVRQIDRPSQKAAIRGIRQRIGWSPKRSLRIALQDMLEEAGI
jgi:UDP-glucose 4-epimerase